MNPDLTVETPAGTVSATARPQGKDSVVFNLSGAMRGNVHVTGTHDNRHWDQFTAVRACLGSVDTYRQTEPAPADTLPRLARSRTGYYGSLTLYRDAPDDCSQVFARRTMQSAAGHEPAERTAAALTAVLRACAEHVEQRTDFPEILTAARERDTPALLRFLTWSINYHRQAAARLEGQARDSRFALRTAVATWWTVARWFTDRPRPVLFLMLTNRYGSLARTIDVQEWLGPYCLATAADEHDRARNAEAEAASLRAQQRKRRTAHPTPSAGWLETT